MESTEIVKHTKKLSNESFTMRSKSYLEDIQHILHDVIYTNDLGVKVIDEKLLNSKSNRLSYFKRDLELMFSEVGRSFITVSFRVGGIFRYYVITGYYLPDTYEIKSTEISMIDVYTR